MSTDYFIILSNQKSHSTISLRYNIGRKVMDKHATGWGRLYCLNSIKVRRKLKDKWSKVNQNKSFHQTLFTSDTIFRN